MTWRLPDNWMLPHGEAFYGKKIDVYGHTIQEYNYVTPHLEQYRTVIDIGAHVGSTTVRYAKDFDRVEAFEPMWTKQLQSNTEHLPNVHRHYIALSDENKELQMVRHSNNSGMSLVVAPETEEKVRSRSWWASNRPKVNTTTLDQYKFTNVDFIKIDTENYVLPILKGAINTLENNNPILQIEATDPIVSDLDNFLEKLGYQLYDTFSVERFYKR